MSRMIPESAQRDLLGGIGEDIWGEDAWDEVDSGESSARVLVRADGEAFAKLVSSEQVSELHEERDRTRWAAGVGLPCAPVLHWSESSAGACLVTGAVPGIRADELDVAQASRAWPGIVRAARALHDRPVDGCPFDRGVDRMIDLAGAVVSADAVRREFLRPEQQDSDPRTLLAELRAEVPRRREQEVADLAVCHGDLCLPNILLDPDSLDVTGFIDLGRLGRADRHADLALLLTNAQDTWPTLSEHLEADLGVHYGLPIDPDRLRFHLQLDPLTWA